jgi:hypothetical protein
MPSTYTVNLGIEKPATGEQSGTWGDTTNVNFDILDQAINGAERVTLSSAGSSGSPNALIITNGAASDGRNKWIEFYSSGDLGGDVFVQLQPNDAEKIVFVRNSLAGSQSVLLFQGTYNSGRDLEIPAGVDMVVKFDGGGASAANVTDVYNNLKVTGLVAGTADINGGTVDGTVIGGASAAALTATTVVANTSFNIAGDGATVTGIKDEDNMASNSATKLATQQSIKAYVDSQVGTVDTLAEILANGNTTGSTDIDVDAAQKVQFRDAAIYINSSVDGQLDIVADTEIQIAATTIDINGAINASGEIIAASLDISGNVDVDGITNLDVVDIDGAVQLDATLTVGVDDTGYDVKFYGATGGAYMLWDESADDLILAGAGGLVVAGNVDFNGDLDVDGTTNLDVVDIDGAVDFASTTAHAGDATFADNAKAIFGAGSDLEIYHDGSNSYIKDQGTGNLNIQTNGVGVVIADTSASDLAVFNAGNGQVSLYNSGSLKLATTATGIDVTGTVTADGATFSGDATIGAATAATNVQLILNGVASKAQRIKFAESGVDKWLIGQGAASETDAFEIYNSNGQMSLSIAKATSAATFSGNVGVGSSDFGSGGSINLSVGVAGVTAGGLQLWASPAQTHYMQFGDATAGGAPYSGAIGYNHATDSLLFLTASSPKLTIASTGAATFSGSVTTNVLAVSNASGGNVASFTNASDADLSINLTSGVSLITPSTGILAFGTSSTERMRIDASGNVGIGTSSPSGKLDVSVASNQRIRFDDFGSKSRISSRNDAAAILPLLIDASDLILNSGSGGNVGIGVTPTEKLDISQSVNNSVIAKVTNTNSGDLASGRVEVHNNDSSFGQLTTYSSGFDFNVLGSNAANWTFLGTSGANSNGLKIGTLTADPVVFGTSDLERMRIDASGNLGLGVVPSAWNSGYKAMQLLTGALYGTNSRDTNLGANVFVNAGGGYAYIQSSFATNYTQFNGVHSWYTAPSGTAGDAISFTQAMTLDASGNLLVGTTSNLSVTPKLAIESTTFVVGISSTNPTGELIRFYGNSRTVAGSISHSGSSVAYNTSSDQRLKENITDADDAGSKIDAIQVRKFDWKADGSHQDYGMVAQELMTVAPEAVSAPEDPEEMMGVDYSKLVPMMLKEIQSLRARIAALES